VLYYGRITIPHTENKVLQALLWLCAYNPVYKSVTIDYDLLDSWPQDYIPQEIRDAFLALQTKSGSIIRDEREGYATSLQDGSFENEFDAEVRDTEPGTIMHSTSGPFLRRWRRMLGLSRQSPSWYRDRLREELRERRTANTPWQKLSETSDVFFSISRAQYDGFPVRTLPSFVASRHALIYVYMLAKYTLHWKFYRAAAILCSAPHYDLVQYVRW
jgi:hypothetical protein